MTWLRRHTDDDALVWGLQPAQVVTAGLVLTASVLLAQTLSQWIDFRIFDLRLGVLDSDHHASVFGVTSILAEVLAGAAIGLRAITTRRPTWFLVATMVAVIAVPRALMRYLPAFGRHDVLILLAPVTLVFIALCFLTFRDPRRARIAVWMSLFLLACSFTLHTVGPQADAIGTTYMEAHTWPYQITGMLKHGAELAGWMLLATGIAAGSLTSRGGRSARRHRFAAAL